MRVPKILLGEAVLTTAYLINCIPLRTLEYKAPLEYLQGVSSFIVPPRVFGCVCFIWDHCPTVGKLDPKALKCVLVGYSTTQKGYKCYYPPKRWIFVSMDVTFRQTEAFFGSVSTIKLATQLLLVQPFICSPSVLSRATSRERKIMVTKEQEQEQEQTDEQLDSDSNQQGEFSIELIMHSITIQQSFSDSAPAFSFDNDDIPPPNPTLNLHIAHKKASRPHIVPSRYRYDIANFIFYESISPAYRSFIALLESISIPSHWKDAMIDPKWRGTMFEEIRALAKNQTRELVPLPVGKQTVGCKWVYTVKQIFEVKNNRYKARLVAKDYTQAYDIDYEEIFAPVAKINTVRTLISCATNLGWSFFQLNVKNAFLHGIFKRRCIQRFLLDSLVQRLLARSAVCAGHSMD